MRININLDGFKPVPQNLSLNQPESDQVETIKPELSPKQVKLESVKHLKLVRLNPVPNNFGKDIKDDLNKQDKVIEHSVDINSIHEVKHQFKTSSVKRRRFRNFLRKLDFKIIGGVLVIALSGFLIAGSGLSVFSQKQSQYKTLIDQCQLQLKLAEGDGVDIGGLGCPTEKLKLTDYFTDVNYKQLPSNSKQIELRKERLQKQIQSADSEISNLRGKLDKLDVDADTLVKRSESLAKLNDTLTNKTGELEKLKKLLADSIPKITNLLGTYGDLLKLATPADQKSGADYIANFKTLSQDEQINKYSALSIAVSDLQDKIDQSSSVITTNTQFKADPALVTKYKTFSGAQFNELYESMSYSKTSIVDSNTSITGDSTTDEYITNLAIARGYKKRAQANENQLVSYAGQRLQKEMQQALQSMQQEALKSGIKIGLVSGYRSVVDQQGIFKSRFDDAAKSEIGKVFTNEEILAGKADKAIDSVLRTSSVPGYSRHHTGYTIDISDTTSKNSFTLFKNTTAYKWISANNFLNAKRFGIIPSYPPGQTQVGPNPEEWEFVWVGVDQLQI